MPDWEDELRDLLAHLDVLYDGSALEVRPTPPARDDEGTLNDLVASDAGQMDASMLALEARAVRTDMEATLARLDQLTRAGQLDPAVRDDVVISLRTLMRPLPARPSPAVRAEWQVTSAAAALHLSRAVMRLTFRLAPPLER